MSNKNMMAIAINKSLCKEYTTNSSDRTIYLKDGDEFQIQLFNPDHNEVAASIWINNQKLSNRIIIRPGERIWLERYLDIAKKFKFDVYEVDANNEEVDKAIVQNGVVKVEFFRKRETPSYSTPITIINDHSYIDNGSWDQQIYTTLATNLDGLVAKGIDSPIASSVAFNSCEATGVSASFAAKSYSNENTAVNSVQSFKPETKETGRISEGSNSNQYFRNVNMNFEYTPFNTETIKILPISEKPYTSSDLEKIYCTNCGRKLKAKFKFCPYCGTQID